MEKLESFHRDLESQIQQTKDDLQDQLKEKVEFSYFLKLDTDLDKKVDFDSL